MRSNLVAIFFVWFFSFVSVAGEQAFAPNGLPILSKNMSRETLQTFARIGGGYYPIPDNLQQYLPETINLARNIRNDEKYQEYYHDEIKQQMTYLYFPQEAWDILPKTAADLFAGMNQIGIDIVRKLLGFFDVSETDFDTITGGLTHNKGNSGVKLIHYNSGKKAPGIGRHKDIRWITILYIHQPGLIGFVDKRPVEVTPIKGYFFVNIGVFVEALIDDSTKVTALIHEVKQLEKDRISFGVFANGVYSQNGFYQCEEKQIVWKDGTEMGKYLVKDTSKIFTTKKHSIFSSIPAK